MARRKKYIRGRVYITNDSLVSNDGYSKKNRRVVVSNNDPNNAEIRKIKSLRDKKGRLRKNLVEIEKYPDINKPSGVEKRKYTKTKNGKPINVKKMKKTKTRLNKWDMKKIK